MKLPCSIGIAERAEFPWRPTVFMTQQINTYRGGPDERGHFGIFGGRFVA
jgi:hypothetical protein